MWKNFLLVALGGVCGSMLRYAVTLLTEFWAHPSWTGTLFVNAVGSFLMGAVLAVFSKGDVNLLLAVGFCGSFTTYSTFSAQTMAMLRNGQFLLAAAYIALTLLVCLLFIWCGMALGDRAN